MSTSPQNENIPAFQRPVSSNSGTFRVTPKSTNSSELEIDARWAEFSRAQLPHLVTAIRQIRQLRFVRENAIYAQVLRREMMKEVAFKRDHVAICDSNLMREFQTLVAQGKLKNHPDLLTLFDKCQDARDTLGPLEKEAIDAERTSEWKWSKVEKAEELAYISLLSLTDTLPSVSSSSSLHDFESVSEHDNFEFDDESIENLDGIEYQELPSYSASTLPTSTTQSSTQNIQVYENTLSQFSVDSDMALDSGRGSSSKSILTSSQIHDSSSQSPSVIDHRLDNRPYEYSIPEYPTDESDTINFNFNPRLLLEFRTIRERINNWLLYGILLSRWEAECLKIQLDGKNPNSPSNWAQLAIAWWNKDDAATSHQSCKYSNDKSEPLNHPTMRSGRPKSLSGPTSYKKQFDSVLPSRNTNANENQTLSPIKSRIKRNMAPIAESKIPPVPASFGAREQFVVLLVKNEQLRSLFERAKDSVSREEFVHPSKLPSLLVTLLSNLLMEGEDPSDRKLVNLFIEDCYEITRIMEIEVYGRRPENTPRSKSTTRENSMPNPIRNRALMNPEMAEKLTRDVRQPKSRWDATSETDLFRLPKSFQSFVLQSYAFRRFCDACRTIFHFQGETIPIENDWNFVPHEPLTASDQKILSTEASTSLGMNEQTLDSFVHEQISAPHNSDDSSVVQNKPVDRILSFEPSQCTEGIEPVQANSSRKREADVAKYEAELSTSRTRNDVKRYNQTYSDAVSRNIPPAKGPFSRTKTAPLLFRPVPVPIQGQKDGNPPKWDSSLSKFEDDESGSKTPTPTDAKHAKSEVPRASSYAGSAATSHATKTASVQGSSIHTIGKSSWLRGDFKQHKKEDFAWGMVFKTRWLQDDDGEYETVISLRTKKSIENFNPKIRRFVIIDKREDHCICLPIVNYSGRRLAKAVIKDKDHATIYTGPPRLAERESELEKPSIRVKSLKPSDKLDSNSKLKYSKTYRVYYDVEVWFMGKVDQNSERVLEESCKEARLPSPMGNRNIQPPPPPPPPLLPVRSGITYAQVAALPGSPNTVRSSIRSFSSSISGRGPRSQSTQPSVFSMKSSGPPWAARQNTFPISSIPSQTTMFTKGRFSTSPTQQAENTQGAFRQR